MERGTIGETNTRDSKKNSSGSDGYSYWGTTLKLVTELKVEKKTPSEVVKYRVLKWGPSIEFFKVWVELEIPKSNMVMKLNLLVMVNVVIVYTLLSVFTIYKNSLPPFLVSIDLFSWFLAKWPRPSKLRQALPRLSETPGLPLLSITIPGDQAADLGLK
jgi:hypothetical protein